MSESPTTPSLLIFGATGGNGSALARRLLDPEQSWVTGQVIAVDGGLSSVQPRLAATA